MACVAPTLIEEAQGAKPIEAKRAELAGVPAESPLGEAEVAEIRAIGDNSGSMLLKGATPDHEGDEAPDRWPLGTAQAEVARALGHRPRAGPDRRRPRSYGVWSRSAHSWSASVSSGRALSRQSA